MGAYLSHPKTDKVSTDELNDLMTVGASSMQGWRNSQEDAHNSLLNFDVNTSFFAVYDGHGGAEVATYCADKLPHFLKELESYKKEDIEMALKEAFLGFDKTLLEPKVVDILKILAGEKNFVDAEESDAHDEDEDVENLAELHEESYLPLNEVLEKYKGGPSMPALKWVKDQCASGPKPQSPYLRGRRAAAVAADAANKAVMDPDSKPAGSSTSAAAAAMLLNDAGPSSSKASSSIAKMETDEPEEDSTVSSSSSSASKSNLNNNNNSNKKEVASSATGPQGIATNGSPPPPPASSSSAATTTVANSITSSDSLHIKENEQNGSVTSSEAKTLKEDVSTSVPTEDAVVSGSNDDVAKRIQNGTVGSTSSALSINKSPSSGIVDGGATTISSTSKEAKVAKKLTSGEEDSTDDDADYDVENSSADENEPGHDLMYFSEDDDDEEEGENSSAEFTTDEEHEEEEDDEDEMTLANEEFCANMVEEPGQDSGCTAVVALLKGRDLYVANAGDSRCVICRNGKAIDMSLDHKPEDDEESSRIIKAGGRVTLDGRVNGGLNLSRAIGDHAYKMNSDLPAEEQMISALPDIKKLIISPEDEFMVLACDGIWNFMSSEEVVDFIRLRLKDENRKISQICEELFDKCLAPNTMGDGTGCDNMTAVIVRFQPKLLELPSKIDPNETEDILLAKRAAEADAADANLQKTLKRSASPTSEGSTNDLEKANKTKRLKTDEEECASSTAIASSTTTSTSTTTTTTSTMPNNSNDNASSSTLASTTTAKATKTPSVVEQKDCDSIATATSEAAVAAAVSST